MLLCVYVVVYIMHARVNARTFMDIYIYVYFPASFTERVWEQLHLNNDEHN